MDVNVVKTAKAWTVELVQGHQSFRLYYIASKKEAEWYAKMFRVALSQHDAGTIERYFSRRSQ